MEITFKFTLNSYLHSQVVRYIALHNWILTAKNFNAKEFRKRMQEAGCLSMYAYLMAKKSEQQNIMNHIDKLNNEQKNAIANAYKRHILVKLFQVRQYDDSHYNSLLDYVAGLDRISKQQKDDAEYWHYLDGFDITDFPKRIRKKFALRTHMAPACQITIWGEKYAY